jgi:hypothetical protein
VVSGAYDFAGRLLAEQRKFAEEVVKATAKLRPGTARSQAGEARDAADEAKPAE